MSSRQSSAKTLCLTFTRAAAVLVCVMSAFLSPAASAQETPRAKRIVALYWYGRDFPSNTVFDQRLQAAFRSAPAGTLEYYPEYLESDRFSGENQSLLLRDYLRQKYADREIDVVFALSNPSLNFLLKYRHDLFPDAPIIFQTIRRPDLRDQASGPGVTGVVFDNAYRNTLDLALKLHPGTDQAFIVTGTPERDRALETEVREELREFEGRVALTYLTDLPLDELVTRVKSSPERSIILYIRHSQDGPGMTLPPRDVLVLVAQSASVPVYGITDSFVGYGIIGGSVFSTQASTGKVAELLLRVANGARPQDIPVAVIATTPMFDWNQLRRWGIDENKLPAGSIVRFKEPTFWEQYKWRIVGAISLIILQALLIVGLLINRSRRRQAEAENERLAQQAEAERRRLDEVVSNVPGIVWESQLEPGGITRKAQFVSDYVEKMLGYSVDEWLATPGFWLSIIPEDDRERASKCSEAVFASGESGIVQFRWRTKEGRLLWVEEHLEAICDDNGKSVGLRGVTLNINERKQAEESLRQSETRFSNMADTAPVMIWISGADKLCTYFNQGWLNFTGRTMEQEQGNGWTEGVYSEDYAHCLEVYQSAFDRREPFKMEYRLRRYDGSFRWVYDSGTPRFSSEGTFLGYIGSCIDISDRKEAEEALQIAHEEVSRLKNQLQEENLYLQEEIRLTHHVDEIIGHSNSINYVLFKIGQVAQTDTTVLILGETGTGKELVARAIHSQSLRKERPLVKVNCAALSGSLIESELFGHEKGAFTGASGRKIGRFELADGATIFLDEIGELPLELQPKLLRVLQEGEIERLGSSKTIKVDVRIITATNRNMKLEVEKGSFREDLWYRLNVFPITVPPLKQRKEDIPAMVEHFVSAFSKKVGKTITSVSSATMKKIQDYSWPGNVRELANVIERAVVTAQGSVLRIADQFEQQPKDLPDSAKTLEEIEKEHITRILNQTAWRVEGPSGAARILGLNPSTLRTRMAKLGIQKSIRTFAGSSRAAD